MDLDFGLEKNIVAVILLAGFLTEIVGHINEKKHFQVFDEMSPIAFIGFLGLWAVVFAQSAYTAATVVTAVIAVACALALSIRYALSKNPPGRYASRASLLALWGILFLLAKIPLLVSMVAMTIIGVMGAMLKNKRA